MKPGETIGFTQSIVRDTIFSDFSWLSDIRLKIGSKSSLNSYRSCGTKAVVDTFKSFFFGLIFIFQAIL